MKYASLAARYILGLIFFVFGLNGFFHFIPMQEMAEPAMKFATAMMETGYLMLLVAGVQVIAGALLLANKFVPFAQILLAPIVVNILMFHLMLAGGPILAIVIVILMIVLAIDKKAAYSPLFK